jgi:hypothetical protein
VLHSGKHNDEVQFYAFDILALNGDDLRSLPFSMRKAHLSRLLARRPDGIFISPFEQGEIGQDLFRAACNIGLEPSDRGWDMLAIRASGDKNDKFCRQCRCLDNNRRCRSFVHSATLD